MISLPSIFSFYSPEELRQYYASDRSIELFGHDRIMACIELARSDESGAIRDYNADAFPIDGLSQQLIIVRSRDEMLIVALVDDEVPPLKTLFAELFKKP